MISSGYILLADDNPSDAELTVRALAIAGVANEVVWVQDGAAALDFVFRRGAHAQRAPGNPRLMLLDLHMPRVDGLDVLMQIKADPLTRSTPIVIMSSADQASDMERSYELHANSYFVKPVDFRQFTDQVALLGKYWTQVNRVGI